MSRFDPRIFEACRLLMEVAAAQMSPDAPAAYAPSSAAPEEAANPAFDETRFLAMRQAAPDSLSPSSSPSAEAAALPETPPAAPAAPFPETRHGPSDPQSDWNGPRVTLQSPGEDAAQELSDLLQRDARRYGG